MGQLDLFRGSPEIKISKEEVEKIVLDSFPGLVRNLFFLDRTYITLSESELFIKMRKTGINNNAYIREEYDCDDYAISIMDNFNKYAVGFCIITKNDNSTHAVNIQIDNDRKIAKLVDPQTNQYFTESIKFLYLVLI